MSKYLIEGLNRVGVVLSADSLEREKIFIDELLRWNKRINLTSIRNYEEALEKHLLDSLLLLQTIGSAKSMLDIGSGGGLPGIPLAIAAPDLQVTSVDSVGKKINFQKHIKRLLRVDNLRVVQARIENLDEIIGADDEFDLVVSRAFADLSIMVKYAEPWLSVTGTIVAMKGQDGGSELSSAMAVVEELGFANHEVVNYKLPYSNASRQLVILQK